MSRLAVICAPDKESLGGAVEKLSSQATAMGAQVDIFDAGADFEPSVLSSYDSAALGMGKDCGETEFLSLFTRCLGKLAGKKTAVFGDFSEKGDFAESLVRAGAAARCVMLPAALSDDAAELLGEKLVRKKEARPDLADTVPIIFSTITGNGYKLAAAAADAVPDHVGPYNIRYITDEVIDKFNTFVLSYWCNHGTADDDTIDLISRMRGKNLIVIGSLGVSVDTAHAAKVCENVIALASEHNNLLGHYLCRGSIDLKRTFARTRIPEGQKGHLSMERFEKQKLSLGHPNEEELEGARAAVAEFLKKR